MSAVDEYLETASNPERAELERIRAIVWRTVPSVEEGVSYAMPAYLYKGKAVLSAMVNRKFMSVYPFSGKVIDKLKDRLIDFEGTPGSIHFSAANPIPEALLVDIIMTRMEEIDARAEGKKR